MCKACTTCKNKVNENKCFEVATVFKSPPWLLIYERSVNFSFLFFRGNASVSISDKLEFRWAIPAGNCTA